MKKWLKDKRQFVIAALIFSLFGTGVTFALPYLPSDAQLDPACAPGDTNCYVQILPALTAGSVVFSDGSTLAQDNANFFWDNSFNRLGIGTNTPSQVLDVNGEALIHGVKLGIGGGALNTNIRFGYNALDANTTGTYNVALGAQALTSNLGASYNVAVGGFALSTNTIGTSNVAIGYAALQDNLDGLRNIAIGESAANNTTSGDDNIAIGKDSLYTNTTGNYNIAIGKEALFTNNGSDNVSIGYQSMYNTGGSAFDNVALGNGALYENTTGDHNTAIGNYAMVGSNTITGGDNTAVGYFSLSDVRSGSQNTTLGVYAAGNMRNGSNNLAIGYNALYDSATINTASQNIAIGDYSGSKITTGTRNTILGYEAGKNLTTALDTVIIGYGAQNESATYSSQSVIIGTDAVGNTGSGTSVADSVVIGYQAAYNLDTSAVGVIAIGKGAHYGASASGGSYLATYNIAIGQDSMFSTQNADTNVSIGVESMYSITNGYSNVAVGGYALSGLTTANLNVALGVDALGNGVIGDGNIGIGFQSGYSSTSDYGIAIGSGTLAGSSGDYNIAIGYDSADNSVTGEKNIAIGYDINLPVASNSQQLTIGNLIFGTGLNGTGTTISSGNIGIGDSSPAALFTVGNGDLFQVTSVGAVTTSVNGTAFQATGPLAFFEASATGSLDNGYKIGGVFVSRFDTTLVNTVLNQGSFSAVTTGTNNFFAGRSIGAGDWSGKNLTSGSYNVAIGGLASITTGSSNIGIGTGSLSGLTGATNSVAIGVNAMTGLSSTGDYNVAIGTESGIGLSGDSDNVAIGYRTLFTNSGNENIAIGVGALRDGAGASNVSIGASAGRESTSGAAFNTILGSYAGIKVAGVGNTFLGSSAGQNVAGGTYNIAIGYSAGDALTTGSKNIIIGYDIDAPSNTTDGQMTIGNLIFGTTIDGTGTTISSGKIGIGDASPDYRFDVDADIASSYAAGFFNDGNNTNRFGVIISAGEDSGAGTLIQFNDGDGTDVGEITFSGTTTTYGTSSDLRMKDNIVDTHYTLNDLLNIKVHDFTFKTENTGRVYTGFIAQELINIYPDAVFAPDDGRMWSVDYGKITPLIVKSIQELDLKLSDITSLDINNSNSLASKIKLFLADTSNGIENFYAKIINSDKVNTKELCVGQVCVTESQFLQIVESSGINQGSDNSPNPAQVDPEDSSTSAENTTNDTENSPSETPSQETPIEP